MSNPVSGLTVGWLADHPELIPRLAPLLHAEWGYLHPGGTLADRVAMLHRHAQRDALPLALVALADGELCGTASLADCDLEGRADLTPWLAGVYVLAAWRGRGIGATLVRAVEQQAARLGYERIYLVTAGEETFYGRIGWEILERRQQEDEAVTVMTRPLSPATFPDQSARS